MLHELATSEFFLGHKRHKFVKTVLKTIIFYLSPQFKYMTYHIIIHLYSSSFTGILETHILTSSEMA